MLEGNGLSLCSSCLLFSRSPCRRLAKKPRPQETGFLNRTIVLNGTAHKYVVYLPETWSEHPSWPVILFLHGSGERGSEGMDQTQIGLPAAIRLHPERWPFIVVMPQVPFNHHHWTDPDMMQTAVAAMEAETREFHGDPERTYLTGLSLGGYGVWEIARDHPHTFAAIVPVCRRNLLVLRAAALAGAGPALPSTRAQSPTRLPGSFMGPMTRWCRQSSRW